MEKDPNFVAAWLESENSLEKDQICETFRIDPNRFFFIDHDRDGAGEGAIDLMESILSTGVIDMCVINSLKMLVPSEEFKKQLSEHVVGVDLGALAQ